MSPEDLFQKLSQASPLGMNLSQTCEDMEGSPEPCRGSSRISSNRHYSPEMEANSFGDFASTGKSPLLKALIDVEAAANAAAIQLMSFKETLDNESEGSRHSLSDSRRTSRQRNLLLDKLEVFKRINKSVRQQLKELQESEANRLESDRHTDILLEKLTEAECENQHLKRDLNDKERRVEELMDMRNKEMDYFHNIVHMTKSVETTRAHLQSQLRSKEAENNRLTVQLRGLERSLMTQKLEAEDLRREITTLSGKAGQEKEALKKATRAQKHRAEKFEAAVDKCYSQLREKDVQLLEAGAERDTWRRQLEQSADDREHLEGQIDLLKCQIADMTEKLQKEREEFTAGNEILLQKVENLNTENGNHSLDNATLKASVSALEQQLACSEATVEEQNDVLQKRKEQAEQYQSQVSALQEEVADLRMKCNSLLRETENIREGKEAEIKKVRQQLEGRVMELEGYTESLRSAKHSLAESQESLRRSEERYADKSESIRQLKVKMECQRDNLALSLEMKESLHKANSQLQEKVDYLQKRMDDMQQENQELLHKLIGQEEALQYSSRSLEQRSAECQALNRQLEATLADVRQQVIKVKEKAVSREGALQTKILELEAEKRRRENELKQLKINMQSAEKKFDVRLKDLQLSLDHSESHKRSIQNYVDFLKNSYATMFDEGLSPSGFGSTYFLK
ncbi:outer dense fiber protein 2-like isoform X1 [Osmerus mordax]|uniref:outer dense fiber protein 2-like isoform X1 n=1 Tax=Osmerus mordax TaxID=8014 RepID=UPI00350EE7A9